LIAGTYNILCEAGSTFGRVLDVQEPDLLADPTGATYTVMNLEHFTARMQVRRTIESTTVMVSLTTENGRIAIDGAIGRITLSMSDIVTAALESSGVYDLEILDVSGNVSRLIQGNFTLIPEVTR